jgi:hypothetical protein
MKNPRHLVEIERIILTGFDLTPGRAERIRALVELELQSLLQNGIGQDGMTSCEVPHLYGPQVHLSEPESDAHLASGVATSIAETLNGVKGA